VGAELFYADGQTIRRTDVTKPIVAFSNLAHVLKNRLLRKAHKTVEPNFTKQKISASTQAIFENRNRNQLSEDAIRVTFKCVTAIVKKKKN
jgi:hypothetical protein